MSRRAVLFVAAGLGAATPSDAQRFSTAFAATAAEHRVDAGSGVEVSRGPVFAVGAQARLGAKWTARLEGSAGRLVADGAGPDRDVGQLEGELGFHPATWLTLEASLWTRTYTAPIARQRWTAAAVGAEARVPFGVGALSAVGRFELQPAVSVSGLSGAGPGFAAAAGVRLQGRRASLSLTYGIERCDFAPTGGVTRRERLSGLTARVRWGRNAPAQPRERARSHWPGGTP